MKLWVDDERPAPKGWVHAWSSDEAVLHMLMTKEHVEEVSLDHDLGGEDTGMRVLDWMIDQDFWPEKLTIHTANPPARRNMLRAANSEAPDTTEIFWIIR